jgi:hypothetical protein
MTPLRLSKESDKAWAINEQACLFDLFLLELVEALFQLLHLLL